MAPLRHSGWLDKQPVSASLSLSWKRRWMTLDAERLMWARDPTSAPVGELPLVGASARVEVRHGRLVVRGSDGRKLELRGPDDDLRAWAAALEGCLVKAPTINLTSVAEGATSEGNLGAM